MTWFLQPSLHIYTQHIENSIMKRIRGQASLQPTVKASRGIPKVILFPQWNSGVKPPKVFHISHTRYDKGYGKERPQYLGMKHICNISVTTPNPPTCG